jgi:hypothetical protein
MRRHAMSSAIIIFSCQPPLHKVIPERSGEVDLAKYQMF